MFRNQYNKMGLQCIVALLALMINGCSFYKVSVENNNVKQEYERVEMLRKTSQLEKKDIKKLTYLYFGNDTLVFPDSLYQFQYEKLDAYFYGEYGMDLYCNWYAYWAGKKNAGYSNSVARKKFSKILYSVNRILEIASGGGNGFMHESNRIPCYVEYYLFYYNTANKVNFNQEEIAVAIESLWQLIDMVIDKNIPTPILACRMTNIFENVKYIESLITDDFYLYGLLNYIEKNVNTIKNE